MAKKKRKKPNYDVDAHMLDFSVSIIDIVEALPNTRSGNHIARKLVRFGTGALPYYSQGQHADSKKEFIQKMGAALKQLRETKVWLEVIYHKKLVECAKELRMLLKDCNELISILTEKVENTSKV